MQFKLQLFSNYNLRTEYGVDKKMPYLSSGNWKVINLPIAE